MIMSEVLIETSYDVRWREPVWVKVGYGVPEAIRGPSKALSYLTFRWPSLRGDPFHQAMRQCKLALRKEVECDVARAAFVRAAQEAEMIA
jgi:hypothetical protein